MKYEYTRRNGDCGCKWHIYIQEGGAYIKKYQARFLNWAKNFQGAAASDDFLTIQTL
jgi:hypothetical protein